MAGEFGIVYPLWNHSDGGGSLLERVIGEVGIEHVTVPVITGARSQFCVYGPRESPYFHTEGGWHFPADAKLYALSGVRPRPARWYGQRDPLKKVCELARGSGINVNFRLDIPAIIQLCDQSPALAQRNAWGDSYWDWGPCINSPAYRSLVEAAIDDLGRYKPDGFELVSNRVDSLSFEVASTTFDRPFGPGFELCFCAACRQIASEHLDPEQAARSVRTHISRFCNSLRPGVTSDDLLHGLHSDEMLHKYVDVRVAAAERWLEGLAARHAEHQFYHGPVNYDSAHIGLRGLRGFKRIEMFDTDAWASAQSAQDGADTDYSASPVRDEGESPRVADALEMGVWFAWHHGSDWLVRAVAEAIERGVTYFDFVEVDETPPETISWLRQAVRFSRRK